jgi:valyl-tRNA synthetase
MNKAVVRMDRPEFVEMLEEALPLVSLLCRVREIAVQPASSPRPRASLSSVLGEGEVSLHVGDVLDIEAEIARLKQELSAVEKTVAAGQGRLEKPDFVARAPREVVEKERARVAEGMAQAARIQENLKSLSE